MMGTAVNTTRMRTPFKWLSAKATIAPWIVRHLPAARVYCEPFAGASAVFWNRPITPVEVLNDLDGNIVNFYRVLQNDELSQSLKKRLQFTPYSRAEYCRAITIGKSQDADEVTRAWAFFVRQNQGFGGRPKATPGRWGRTTSVCSGGPQVVVDWVKRVDAIEQWHHRLKRCYIENIDAVECIKVWDSKETTFYLDPPYVAETWGAGDYCHEMPNDKHTELVSLLLNLQGAAVISGYDNTLYNPLLEAGWTKATKETKAFSTGVTRGKGLRGKGTANKRGARVEVLWISPRRQRRLF